MQWAIARSLIALPYFDGSNYAFWKVRMRAFLCPIDEAIWDAVEIGWTKPEATKSTWDKAAKSIKLQMLTTRFEELRMSEDESFDSFYSKLNEVVISKFNLGEKMEDLKVVQKILHSLPESFRAKVTAIEENKDLYEIKVQELIGSL